MQTSKASARCGGDVVEEGLEAGRGPGSPLLEPAEQQMLKLITDKRSQGASLSEILGDLELTSGADKPIFRLAPSVEQKTWRSTAASGAVGREARFVPYEPYRACVSPLVVDTAAAEDRPKRRPSAASRDSGPPPVGDDRPAPAGADLDRLRRDNEQLEQQLNVSMEVTAELKKLLVASIGEDIESRLHLLTEDKAHMAQLVRSFSARAAEQGERRDQLSIQCDVWRSKFMACSLMVDELAGWKAVLGRRCREMEAALRSLMAERRGITQQMEATARHLSALREAVDPLQAWQSSAPAADGDSVQLAERLASLSGALHERLLGRPPAPAPAPADGGETRPSAAELAADKVPPSPAELAADKVPPSPAELAADKVSPRPAELAERVCNAMST